MLREIWIGRQLRRQTTMGVTSLFVQCRQSYKEVEHTHYDKWGSLITSPHETISLSEHTQTINVMLLLERTSARSYTRLRNKRQTTGDVQRIRYSKQL